MKSQVLIVANCEKVEPNKSWFTFNGTFHGYNLKHIRVKTEGAPLFEEGKNYILNAEILDVWNHTLKVKHLRSQEVA